MIRFCDILFSLLGLLILWPFFLLIALAIVLESRGGVFYTQQRVGRNGKDFLLYKFRSMRSDSDKKGLLTVGKDHRITQIGIFIRKYKLDELPQLCNVLKGEMSLVGPRPEVRKYVNIYTPEQMKVLSVRPGITDYASIEYVDESTCLSNSADPEKTYIEQVLPDKIKYNLKYINNYTLHEYFKIIFLTFYKVISR